MKEPIRIMGVDPGFDRLGVGIINCQAGKQTVVYSDCWTTHPGDDFPARLAELAGQFKKILAQHQPDVLAMESLIFSSNQKTAIRVAELRGVIIYLARTAGVPVIDYSPPQIKLTVAGYGRAGKDQISQMVRQLLKISDAQKRLDDEYDALAVCLTHAAHHRLNEGVHR